MAQLQAGRVPDLILADWQVSAGLQRYPEGPLDILCTFWPGATVWQLRRCAAAAASFPADIGAVIAFAARASLYGGAIPAVTVKRHCDCREGLRSFWARSRASSSGVTSPS